jgi:ABC-type phosphate transport system auxiliary subunit
MRTFDEIHREIDRLSEQRTQLYQQLSAEYDAGIVADIRRIDTALDHLWDEHRALRARVRFGDRNAIVARARVEERLERAA